MTDPRDEGIVSNLLPLLQSTGAQIGAGTEYIASALAAQVADISHQIDLWMAGEESTLKVISGDFRPGRAIMGMDGIRLRNRDNELEDVPFVAVARIDKLQAERRVSAADRLKNASIGSLVGGGIGTVAGLTSLVRTGTLGAAVGGSLGALLTVGHKYRTCRVTLRDDRKMIAVAANTSWLALLASMPEKPTGFFGKIGFRR